MKTLAWILALAAAATAAPRPLIIDTDAGSDDLLAIAFLLARPEVRIEAITVVHGLAHVPRGVRNVRALLRLAGRDSIPVFGGAERPLAGGNEFPAAWRKVADELAGVELPDPGPQARRDGAIPWLARRLGKGGAPAAVLALGPLTNLAEAQRIAGGRLAAIEELWLMAGAVRVAGNVGDGGAFPTENKTAEWNLFADPLAARVVLGAAKMPRLVPLDATNRVPVDARFLARIREISGRGPLARFVAQVLESDRKVIDQGIFYAWDPLAAVALAVPGAVTFEPLRLEFLVTPAEEGRTREIPGPPNALAGLSASREVFEREFTAALERAR